MEEKKMKMCLRCNENFEATADNFYRRSASKDGLEPYCKRCKNKMADGDTTATKKRKPPHNKNARRRGQDAINRLRPHPNLLSHRLMTAHKKSLTMASPEAIIAALRKGVAREIIKLIEEKFA